MTAPGWPRGVLFDLDGTLIDSAPDIRAAVNQLLAAHSHPPLSLEQIVSMIGEGSRRLTKRAFAASGEQLDEATLDARYQELLPLYGANLTGLTTLYPHVAETLAAFHSQGVRMALVTNKPNFAIAQILRHFGLIPYFPVIVGADSGVPHKPAPDMVLLALEKAGLSAKETLFVGDSPADAQAAKAAGVKVAILRYGYSREDVASLGADFLLDDFAGLLKLPQDAAL